MLKVTSHDYNFYKLVEFIQEPPKDTTEIVSCLQSFRARFSFRWIEPLLGPDTAGCISSVLLTLFTHANSTDAAVRINVYSALGAFFHTLTPFVPVPMMQGLMAAIHNFPAKSPSSSIAIISSFLYMVHYINPNDLDYFITNTPVLHHFSTDVSDYIRYVPHLVKLMQPLPEEFDQNFLRSLLTSFGRNPNRYFVDAVVELIKMSPALLLKNLMDFCIGNNLRQTILAIGADLISNDNLFNLLNESQRTEFLKEALSVLNQDNAILGDFEQAVGILAAFIKRSDGEQLKEVHEKINAVTKDKSYPKHFRKFTILLETDVNELKFCNEDPGSLKIAKLKALAEIITKMKDDKEMCKAVLGILNDYINCTGDVLTAFINTVSATFRILKDVDSKSVSEIISYIMKLSNTTWVQNLAIINLLTSIGLDDGCLMFKFFDKDALEMLLDFGMSPQEELSKAAIDAIIPFTTLQNLKYVKKFLLAANCFEEESAKHTVQILLKLTNFYPASEFAMLASIVSEIPQLHSNPILAGLAFEFLAKVDYDGNSDLADCCLDWVSRLYKSILQSDPPVASPLKYDQLPYMISTIETDIIANDLIDQHSSAKPLLQCFKYLMKLNIYCIPFINKIVRLFPNALIPLANSVFPDKTDDDYISFTNTVCEILGASSSLKSCAICARFLHTARADFRLKQTHTFIKYLTNPRPLTAEQISAFDSIVAFGDEKNAKKYRNEARERVTDEIQKVLLEIKFNEFNEEKMANFSKNVPFEKWPVSDSHFAEFIESKIASVSVMFNENIDDDHIFFAVKHDKVITVSNIEEFTEKHPKRMLRFRYTPHERIFTFKPVTEECKVCSLFPEMKNAALLTHNISLLRSFFRSSTYKITQDLYDKIFKENDDEELCIYLIDYASRHRLSISPESVSKFATTKNEKLLKELYLTDDALESVLPGYKEKDLIDEMETDKYTIINVAIKSDPTLFFKKFVGSHPQNKKVFIKLIYFLSLYKPDPMVLDEYVLSCVNNPELEEYSNKKLTALLRLVHAHFISMNPTATAKKGECFNQSFFDVLNKLINCPYETVKKELARCFRYYFSAKGPGNSILAELDEHEKLYPKTPTYIECLTRVFAFSGSGVRLRRGILSDTLQSDLPSYKTSALRCLHFLLQPQLKKHAWEIVTTCLSKALAAAEFLADIPVADQTSVAFLLSLTKHPSFDNYKSEIITKSLKFVMREPSAANFNLFFPLVTQIMSTVHIFVPQYKSFVDKIAENPCPLFPDAFRGYKEYRIRIEKSEQGKEDSILEYISQFSETFTKMQSVESAVLLANVLSNPETDFDSLSLIVGRYCMANEFTLPMLVVVAKTVGSDETLCKEFGKLMEDLKEGFPSKERSVVFNYVSTKNYEKAIESLGN